MNLFSYIDKYSCYTFKEVEFNEIDNLVFSSFAYVSLSGYVSNNRFNKKSLRDVGASFFRDYDDSKKYITAIKVAVKVFRYIKDTRRYGDLLLYNYSYIGNDKQQFSAITIEINKRLVYVSYEGTDQLISGWKEDFMGETRTLDMHIASLRDKIKKAGGADCIVTVRGVGYRYENK